MIQKEKRFQTLHQQTQRLQQRIKQLQQTASRYSWLRLGTFSGGLLISGLVFYWAGPWPFAVTFLLCTALFGFTIYLHRHIENSIEAHQTLRHWKHSQLARMTLDWPHIPAASSGVPNYEHPFEADLDLVGNVSLHRLIDTAVSYEGSKRLKSWLTTSGPQPEQLLHRQQLIRELTPRFLFRNRLTLNATLAAGTRKMWDANQLTVWLKNYQADTSLRGWFFVLIALVILNIILLLLNLLGIISAVWQLGFILYFGLLLLKSLSINGQFESAIKLQDSLKQLAAVFQHLEQYSYRNTPHLKDHCAPFLQADSRPSHHLSRIVKVIFAAGLRSNPITWLLLNTFFPWDIYFARKLAQHTLTVADHIKPWLDVWFELEALSSLANLAYLNPHYTLPNLIPNTNNPTIVFKAQQIGHPLIPDTERVTNDFAITELGQLKIITGSNMAGKSTFLRTIGANLALTFAGGPVAARQLDTIPFRLFTCIKVSDSVTNGISYFYAEVKRLKALLTALNHDDSLPLFFFIDEIFRGTNNRERLIGSQSYLHALIDKHGLGLVSTHDLELASLADNISTIENHHFRDDVIDDRMAFDYTLRPGPCPTTNALKIMQMEGLPVEENGGVGD